MNFSRPKDKMISMCSSYSYSILLTATQPNFQLLHSPTYSNKSANTPAIYSNQAKEDQKQMTFKIPPTSSNDIVPICLTHHALFPYSSPACSRSSGPSHVPLSSPQTSSPSPHTPSSISTERTNSPPYPHSPHKSPVLGLLVLYLLPIP